MDQRERDERLGFRQGIVGLGSPTTMTVRLVIFLSPLENWATHGLTEMEAVQKIQEFSRFLRVELPPAPPSPQYPKTLFSLMANRLLSHIAVSNDNL